VTVEFQREKAKELVRFFKQQQANALINDSAGLGWTSGNEILNGRSVMFGMMVGLITELATGVDFPNQLKLTVSVLGIAGAAPRQRVSLICSPLCPPRCVRLIARLHRPQLRSL